MARTHTSAQVSCILTALGFERELVEEHWEDVGGPESGPKIVGNPESEIWGEPVSRAGSLATCIVISEHEVLDQYSLPVFDDIPF